jgi:hypothetical protein
MMDDIRKGTRGQLIGLNLWVVSAFMGFILFMIFLSSFLGFILAMIVIVLFIMGTVRILRGLYLIIRGSGEGWGKTLSMISAFLLFFSPFIVGIGIISPTWINYILLQIGLIMFFTSLVLPYLSHGGKITGTLAIISSVGFSGVILGFIFFGRVTLPWTLPFGLAVSYFILLELTIFISYLKALKESDPGEGTIPSTSLAPVSGPGYITPRAQPLRSKVPERVTFSMRPQTVAGEVPAKSDSEGVKERPGVTTFEDFVREMGVPKKEPEPRTARPFTEFTKREEEKKEKEKLEAEVEEEIELDMEDVLMDGEDLYSILRVKRSANIGDLRRAYRKRALLYHPDLNRDAGELYRDTINEEMRKLNKAKEVLFDPFKRTEYDRRLDSL